MASTQIQPPWPSDVWNQEEVADAGPLVVRVFRLGAELATLEFHGQRKTPLSDGTIRVVNPGDEAGYRALSGDVPEALPQLIWDSIRAGNILGTVQGHNWRAV